MNWLNRFKRYTSEPFVAATVSVSILVGCSSGSDDPIPVPSDPPFDERPLPIEGSAVKGPVIDGVVTIYDLDFGEESFKGDVVATGSTNEAAKFSNVIFPADVVRTTKNFSNTMFLIDVTGGRSITTGVSPVIEKQQVILSGSDIRSGESIYATPFTTLAYELALLKYDEILAENTGSGPHAALAEAFEFAAKDVITAFGFGQFSSEDDIDIRYISPVAVTVDSLGYRTAIEALAAIVEDVRSALIAKGINDSALLVLEKLADDLSDGVIDGTGVSGRINGLAALQDDGDLLPLIQQDPSTLEIPGTNRLITELNDILLVESAIVSPGTTPDALSPLVSIPPALGGTEDADNDGVLDVFDLFPNNPKEAADSDGDCATAFGYTVNDYLGDAAGSKPEGCGDNDDYFPNDAAWQSVCDNPATSNIPACGDSDSDGTKDADDLFPFNGAEQSDSDGDCATTLNYEEADYLTPTAGNDCGDNFDYTICYDVEYARVITLESGGFVGLYGGTVLHVTEGGPLTDRVEVFNSLVLNPLTRESNPDGYWVNVKGELDIVEGIIHVPASGNGSDFDITVNSYQAKDPVSRPAPNTDDDMVAYSKLYAEYLINVSNFPELTGLQSNTNCRPQDAFFLGVNNFGCAPEDDPSSVFINDLIEDPSYALEVTTYPGTGDDAGLLSFDFNTTKTKTASAIDRAFVKFRGTKISSDESCPTQ